MLDVELFLQASARLKEAIAAVFRDRARLALALAVQHATPFTHPRPTTLRARDERARIKLDGHPLILIGRRFLRLAAFTREALFGLPQCLAAALPGMQKKGQPPRNPSGTLYQPAAPEPLPAVPHPLDLMQSRSGPAKSSPQQVLRVGVHHGFSLRPRFDATPGP